MGEPKFVNTQYAVEIYTFGDYNEELTTTFTSMRIMNSVRACWPMVELHFNIDNQTMIEKNIYGSEDIIVYIWFVDDDGEKVPDPMIWELLYLESNLTLPQKPEVNGPWDDKHEVQRRETVVSCLSRPSFLTMTSFVNRLYEGDDTGMTPYDCVNEIADLKGLTKRFFDKGKNEDTIPQLLVPPMTMKSAIDYIDEKFGIYKGPLFRYANYAGQLCMWDLKERWEETKADGFTKTHKLPAFTETHTLYDTVSELVAKEPDQFITYDNVETLHYGNALVAKNAYDNIYIVHPHDDIAFFHKRNADTVITEEGLWHDSDVLKYHEELKQRRKYYYDWKGFETGDGYTGNFNDYVQKSSLATMFMDGASVKFTVYRKVKISLVSRVGEDPTMKVHI
jgi:hypothetical protein